MVKVPGEETCPYLYHTVVFDNTGRHDIAIALSAVAQAELLVWVPILPVLKGGTVNVYDDLQDVIDSDASGDMMISTGDWNARHGPTDKATRYILGKVALVMGYANAPPPQKKKIEADEGVLRVDKDKS